MWIEIDDDLAERLEGHMRLDESREGVVRRLLLAGMQHAPGDDSPDHDADRRRTRTLRAGSIPDLLRAGLVRAGDELTYSQVRQRLTHTAIIDADGGLRTSLGVERSPSSALQNLVGFNINGWRAWVHVPSGKSLSALRDELPQ